jgi:predicted small secreted protein
MRKYVLIVSVLLTAAFLAGCGETVNGMVKDTKRVGAGIGKIFIRDSS